MKLLAREHLLVTFIFLWAVAFFLIGSVAQLADNQGSKDQGVKVPVLTETGGSEHL